MLYSLFFLSISERPRPVAIMSIEVTSQVKITIQCSSWNVRKFRVEMSFMLVGTRRLQKKNETVAVNDSCSPCDLRPKSLMGKEEQLQFVSVRVQAINTLNNASDYSSTAAWGSCKYKL